MPPRHSGGAAMRGRGAIAAILATLTVVLGLGSTARAADQPRPMVGGWYGWWLSSADVATLVSQNGGSVPEVNVFWWFFHGADQPLCTFSDSGTCLAGTATPWTSDRLDAQRVALQQGGVKVLATITDLDNAVAGQLSDYLATPERRSAYAKQITDWAIAAGVDGVDLDWENFAFNDGQSSWAATRPRWVAFVQELGQQLHSAHLILSATVPAGIPAFLPDGKPNPSTGYTVYDWPAIIAAVDRLRIMAYEYSGSWSGPGPIGPNYWADEVIASAVEQVGAKYAERIWIGEPQYGRNWPLRNASGGWASDASCPSNWKPTIPPVITEPSPSQSWAIAQREGVAPTWDADAAEWHFVYYLSIPGSSAGTARDCKVKRELWFADTRSAVARAQLAIDHRIGGIAVWSFDSVDDSFYPELLDFATAHAPTTTTVAIRAPKTLAKGVSGSVRVTVSTPSGVASGTRVTLTYTPSGTTKKIVFGRATTDAKGIARFTVTPKKTGRWTATTKASWARQAGVSKSVQTTVS